MGDPIIIIDQGSQENYSVNNMKFNKVKCGKVCIQLLQVQQCVQLARYVARDIGTFLISHRNLKSRLDDFRDLTLEFSQWFAYSSFSGLTKDK